MHPNIRENYDFEADCIREKMPKYSSHQNFKSLSQWNLIIGSGRIVEYQIDTKITLSDDVNQKNIPQQWTELVHVIIEQVMHF
jgi:hypothetical protein